jgi:hypothetical protein
MVRAESCDPISSHGPEPRITFRVNYKDRACILKLMFALKALHSLASAISPLRSIRLWSCSHRVRTTKSLPLFNLSLSTAS